MTRKKDKPQLPDCLLLTQALQLEAADDSDDEPRLRRFSMTAYTGGAMPLEGWPFPVVLDLSGLRIPKAARPILKDHDRSQIIGHTDHIVASDQKLTVAGIVPGAGAAAAEVVASSDNGFPWQASIGARANKVVFVARGRTAKANGREFKGPIYIARKSSLGEISFVALGADENTSAKVAANSNPNSPGVYDMEFEQWLEAKGFSLADLDENQTASLKVTYEAELEAKKVADGDAKIGVQNDSSPSANVADSPASATEVATGNPAPSAPATSPTPSTADSSASANAPQPPQDSVKIQANTPAAEETSIEQRIAADRAAYATEQNRWREIEKICAGEHPKIQAQAIAEGWDPTRTELAVLRASRPQGPAIQTRDANRPTGAALEAALCMSAGLPQQQVGQWYDDRAMEAALTRDLSWAGLHTLFYEVIRASGGYVRPGRVDNETIRAAFVANGQLIQASGGFSTLSLSGILSNVANKTMLAAYQAVNAVATQICAQTDVNDFKQVTRYRMTAAGIFQKVGADGELKHATLDEESYTNQIDTYGRLISLTRQMIINDDLGAFLQIPRAIGRMSALALEEAVFTLLLANPGGFFSAGNKNYFDGADSDLDIDSLTKGEQLFLDRVNKDGKPILIQPALLLVPTSRKVTAEQLVRVTDINQVPANNKPAPATNPHAGKFRPVTSPYRNVPILNGASEKAWYLFADPSDVAAMEIAYLRGRRSPTIESGETDFNTLGMQWRGYFDFGVAMQDHRAAVKSKGEA